MYISELKTHNFRCFSGKMCFRFNSGLNYFIGNNNCGKTTVIKAIDFLLNGKSMETHCNVNPNSKTKDKDKTMTVYIRNYIDHPEDDDNPDVTRSKPTMEDIKKSI